MAKLSGGMAVGVLEYKPESVSSKGIAYKIADCQVPNDQNTPLEADEPRVIGVLTLQRLGDFVGFLEVMGFISLAGFN